MFVVRVMSSATHALHVVVIRVGRCYVASGNVAFVV